MMASYDVDESFTALKNGNYTKVFNILKLQTEKVVAFAKDEVKKFN